MRHKNFNYLDRGQTNYEDHSISLDIYNRKKILGFEKKKIYPGVN